MTKKRLELSLLLLMHMILARYALKSLRACIRSVQALTDLRRVTANLLEILKCSTRKAMIISLVGRRCSGLLVWGCYRCGRGGMSLGEGPEEGRARMIFCHVSYQL